ncbi:MAG: OmpH family outer membrane protein [Alphaproteobacteria bacterium]|nr:OmpH family outer membrane protein [Alphaproteobacteria bacterium]
MNNKITLSLGAAAILCAGIGIGCTIKCCGNKMAVVDVATIVNKSTEVKALKTDVETKTQELTLWLQGVQKEVKSEGNKEKQEALLQRYNAEFVQKRDELSKDYNEKLQAVDKDINDTIIKTAKEKGYKSVISKGVVIYGGDDITEEVIKVIK